MFSFRRFFAVAKKEFLELRRNKLFCMLTILAPVILFFLFAFGFSLEARNIPIGFVDRDGSDASRRFIDRFAAASDIFDIKTVGGDYKELERGMDLDAIRAIIVIPEDFSVNIKKSMPVTVQILIDGANPVYANSISTFIQAIGADFQYEVLNRYFVMRDNTYGGLPVPIDLSVSAWYNPSFRNEDFIIPGIVAIIIMFFPPLVAAVSLAKEKETGSILNMYCSCVTKAEYLLGKMMPYIAIGFLNAVIFIVLSMSVFGVPMRGSVLALGAATLFFVGTAIAVGLLVAVLVGTQVAAIIITSIIVITPSFLYSGFMVPLSSLGESAQEMAVLTPATFYIDVIRKIMVKGAGFANIRLDMLVIAGTAIGLYVLCIALFKKRIG